MRSNSDFETKPFRMTAGNFMVSVIFSYAWIWLLSLSLLGIMGLVLGITLDIRWLIAGLMLIFIVAPMLLAFLYFSYGLKKECYINTVSHSLKPEEEGITVRLLFDEPREEFFSYSVMNPVTFSAKSLRISFKSPFKGFLWIPHAAFRDEQHLVEVLRFLDSKIISNSNPVLDANS